MYKGCAFLKALPRLYIFQKMFSAYYLCCLYLNVLKPNFVLEANTMNPDLGPYCVQ